jgi:fibronectin type 3 domain-containing protein
MGVVAMRGEDGRGRLALVVAACVLLLGACVAAVAAADPGDGPSSTAAPTISGQAQVAQLLSASQGSWAGAAPMSYGYQWRRCDEAGAGCEDIAGATGESYRLRAADLSATLRVVVTATNATGSAQGQSSATVAVSAGGAYPAAVLDTSGLAHYWRLGEAAGSTLWDSVGSSDATATAASVTLGATGALTGDSDTATAFDGLASVASAPLDLSGTDKLTLEFWLRWPAFADDDKLAMEFTSNFNDHDGGFLVDPNAPEGGGRFAVSLGAGSSRNGVMFQRPTAGDWHHYALVLDTGAPAADQIIPYVDGQPVSYDQIASGTGAGTFADAVLHFMSRNSTSLLGAGDLDELAIYTSTLSATTISEHYHAGAGNRQPTARFSASPRTPTAGEQATLDASGSTDSDGSIARYEWDFDGDGVYDATTTTPTVTHTYPTAQTTTVKLRITDDQDATDTIEHAVRINAQPGPYAHAVLDTSGLAHYWRLGEASGSTLWDSVGSADATATSVTLGAAGALAGDGDTATAFDGLASVASAPVNLSGTDEATVEFWLKWSAYADDDRLAMEFTSNFNDHDGGFLVDPNAPQGAGKFAVSLGQGASRNGITFQRPTAGTWHHYAFVLDASAPANDQIMPYVDGQAVSHDQIASGTGAATFADAVLHFMSRNSASLLGAGSLDDLALYTTKLNAQTISEHYRAAVGNQPPTARLSASPRTPAAGQTVTFDASDSSDADGVIATYEWDLDGDGTYGTTTSTPTVTHTYPTARTVTVGLRVADDQDATDTTTRIVRVTAETGPYARSVLDTAGLAHYWRLGESTGTTLSDSAGTADATATNVTFATTGALAGDDDTAARFDGSTSTAAAPVDLSGTNKATVEFWLKWPAYANDDRLAMEFTPNFNSQSGGFLVDPNAPQGGGKFAVSLGVGDSRNGIMFQRPTADDWHHYAFVLDTAAPAAEQIVPYVDGDPVSHEQLASGTGAGNFADSTLYLMSRNATSLLGAGDLDDLAIYTTKLGEQAIHEHYLKGVDRGPNDTVLPDVAGTTQVGEQLTANAGAWEGIAPIEFAYQWLRCSSSGTNCEAILAATEPSYAPSAEDVGSRLRVRVTASDAAGSTAVESAATAAIDPDPRRGPIVALSFDEDTGAVAHDASGAGHDASIEGATWSQVGRHGHALSFDGDDDVVSIPAASGLALSDAMTLEAWVRPASLHPGQTIMRSETIGAPPYVLFATGPQSAQPMASIDDQSVRANAPVVPDEWQHVALTYDGSTLRLYVNGELAGEQTGVEPSSTSGGRLLIGGSAALPADAFDGQIDELRVYDRALTVDDLRQDARQAINPPQVTLSGELVDHHDDWLSTGSYALEAHAVATAASQGLDTVQISIDGRVIASETGCDGASCSIQSDVTFAPGDHDEGSHDVDVVAVDRSGAIAERSLTVHVDQGSPTTPQRPEIDNDNDVRLSWRQGDEADLVGYDVYRRAAAEQQYELITPDAPVDSSFHDQTAQPGQTLTYALRARDGAGHQSGLSEAATIVVDEPAADAPQGLRAESAPDAVHLYWQPQAGSDGYEVFRRTGPNGPLDLLADEPSASSEYVDETADAGTTYTYVVRSVDDSGRLSQPSDPVQASPGAPAELLPQVALSGSLIDHQAEPLSGTYSLRISASEGTPEHPAAGITDSEVFIDGDSHAHWSQGCATGNCELDEEFMLDTGPLGDGTHTLEVIATDARDRSTSEVLEIAIDDGAPTAPHGLTGSFSSGFASLQWDRVDDADLAGYDILRAVGPSGQFESIDQALFTSAEAQDLAPTTDALRYKVVAVDGAGHRSLDSNIVTIAVGESLDQPTGLAATSDPGVVHVAWEASDNADGYLVSRSEDSGGPYNVLTDQPTTEVSLTDTTVRPGETYYYIVRATTSEGRISEPSSEVEIAVAHHAVQPTLHLSGTLLQHDNEALSTGSYDLHLDATEDNGPGITLLEARVDGDSKAKNETPCPNGGCSLHVDVSFNPDDYDDGPHSIEAVAVDGTGEATTASVTAVVERSAPEAVSGFVAHEEGTTVRLDWDANGEADLESYQIYRATGSDASQFLDEISAAQTSYSDTTLALGSTYRYVIRARDHSGHLSPPSAEQTVALGGASALTPTGLQATSELYAVSLTWDAVQASDLAGYQVYRRINEGDQWERLTGGPIAEPHFIDEAAPIDAPASYIVRTVNGVGHEGPATDSVSAAARALSTPAARRYLRTYHANPGWDQYVSGDDRTGADSAQPVPCDTGAPQGHCYGDGWIDNPALSPDAAHAAFWQTTYNQGGASRLALVVKDMQTGHREELCVRSDVPEPGVPYCRPGRRQDWGGAPGFIAFSPIGATIIYGMDGVLYRIAASGGSPQVVVEGPLWTGDESDDGPYAQGSTVQGGITAAGRMVFGGYTEDPKGDDATGKWKNFTANSDGSGLQELTLPDGVNEVVHPTPDGEGLVGLRDQHTVLGTPTWNAVYIPLNGDPVEDLTPSGIESYPLAVSPDGARVLVGIQPEPDGMWHDTSLYSIGIEARDRRLIAEGSEDIVAGYGAYAQATKALALTAAFPDGTALRSDDTLRATVDIQPINTTVDDVSLIIGGDRISTTANSSGSVTLESPLADVPEGRHSARVVVRAGSELERARKYTVIVDNTEPNRPAEVYTDPVDADTVEIGWSTLADPDLADGAPGSGIQEVAYRYQRLSGGWTAWTTTTENSFRAPSADVAGQVELRVSDHAGNTATARATAGRRRAVAYAYAPSAGGAHAAATTPGKRIIECASFGKPTPVPISLFHGEADIALEDQVATRCSELRPDDPAAHVAFLGSKLSVSLCLQVSGNALFRGAGTNTFKCERIDSFGVTTFLKPQSIRTRDLCRAGERHYRSILTVKLSVPPGFEGGSSRSYSGARVLPCNEAGAWRRVADRDKPGKASRVLAANLVSLLTPPIDRDPLPAGPGTGQRGWEAHHIVPAGDGRGPNAVDRAVSLVQKLGYTCNLDPNAAFNGLWLRGRKIYTDVSALKPQDRKRPRHQSLHTEVHFRWVASYLDDYATSQGTCLSAGGMKAALRRMRAKIAAGDAPS